MRAGAPTGGSPAGWAVVRRGEQLVRIRVFRVRPEMVGRLRSWCEELGERRDEVVETFANETVRHEMAWLAQTTAGPFMTHLMEAVDLD